MIDKKELKKALQDRKELLQDNKDLDRQNLLIASSHLGETIDNLLHVQDQLLESIIDFHTFFEIFFEKYKVAPPPDRALLYKELSFLNSNLNTLMKFVEEIANNKSIV